MRRDSMTSLNDLLWLYKMAVQFNLESEKTWLKQEIEERLSKVKNKEPDIKAA
jgi:hypothetical protein